MHKLSEFNQKRMQELNEIYAGIFSGLQYWLEITAQKNTKSGEIWCIKQSF